MSTTTTIIVSGNFEALTGVTNGYVVITLVGYGNAVPSVPGVGVIVNPSITSTIGSSFVVVIFGNDVITPANTYYNIAYYSQQNSLVASLNYLFSGTEAVDLSTASPISTIPANFVGNPVLLNTAGTQTIVNGLTVGGTLTAAGGFNISGLTLSLIPSVGLSSMGMLVWVNGSAVIDSGISRIAPKTFAFGNGTAADYSGTIKCAAVTGLTAASTPNAAGGTTLGSAALPFSSVYIGGAATNNIQLTGTATGSRVVTFPDASTSILVSSYTHTIAGPTAARTFTYPDAAITVARTDAAQTFSGTQNFSAISLTATNAATITPATMAAARAITLGDPGAAANLATTTGTLVAGNIPQTGNITGNLTDSGLSTLSLNGFKNRIINGDMRIDQRNAGAQINPVGGLVFGLDRTYTYIGNMSVVATTGRSTLAPPGFVNSLALNITTGNATNGTSNQIFQNIEGYNVSDLSWGTTAAQEITLSFWVRCSLTGQFGGSLQNGASNRSYPFTYAVASANTWQKMSITVPGDTTGTWATDNTLGIAVVWDVGSSTAQRGPAGVWASADYRGAAGDTSVVATTGASFYLTGVQFELGSTATPFERVDYGSMLARCQRYYTKLGGSSTAGDIQVSVYALSATNASIPITWPVTMRVVPAGTIVGSWLLSNTSTVNIITGLTGGTIYALAAATGMVVYYTNGINTYLTLSAEL